MVTTYKPREPDEKDLTLAVMLAMAPGHEWGLQEIADCIGISHQGVRDFERRALRKLNKKLRFEGYHSSEFK